MELTVLSAVFSVIIVLNLAHRGWRCRLRGGRLDVVPASRPTLQTDLGRFIIDSQKRELRMDLDGQRYILPFDDIRGIDIDNTLEWAGLSEFLFDSFSLFDLSGRYRDQVQGYQINLLTPRGMIPFMDVRQHKVRDFLDWATPIQLWFLSRLGWHTDVKQHANHCAETLSGALRLAGVNVDQLRRSTLMW